MSNQSELPSDESSDEAGSFLREAARAPNVSPFAGDLSGRVLGRYRIERRLGRGGMGVVYLAEDQVLQRHVALKVLPPHLVGDARRRRHLLREARSAARAAHPGIGAVFDVQEIDEHVVIAMERIEGVTLRERILEAKRVSGGLAPAEVLKISRPLAAALAHAHRAGVIHRDLKPENVMLAVGDQVKILDFGLAKLQPELSANASEPNLSIDEQQGGTPSYMAPEQASGKFDERSDVFSFGVILYELATGARPFGGATRTEVLYAIERDVPRPPSELARNLPHGLEALILQCLAKKPEERPPSMDRVSTALDGLVEKKPRIYTRKHVAAVVAILAAVAVAILIQRSGDPTLLSPGTTLACPLLEAKGVEAPTGWLGAAAASMICARAQLLAGGDASVVLVPAALLDLPRQPGDDFPPDPYAESDARERSLAAARSRATAYFDGAVSRTRTGFRVQLDLRDAAGYLFQQGSGEGPGLHSAVRAAMTPFVASGALSAATAVMPDVATWQGIRDPELFVAAGDRELSEMANEDQTLELAKLEPHAAQLGNVWTRIQASQADEVGHGWDTIRIPAIDRSTAATFARSAPLVVHLRGGVGALELADEAARLAAVEPSFIGRAALNIAEAQLRGNADHVRTAALLLAAAAEDPTGPALALLQEHAEGPARVGGARAFAAWHPNVANAWNTLAITHFPTLGYEGFRRAHSLGTRTPFFAVHLAMWLIDKERREDARALVADMASRTAATPGPDGQVDVRLVANELVFAQIEASEAHFGAAIARLERALFSLPAFGRGSSAEIYLLTLLMDLAALLDAASGPAERFVRTFVDPDPPKLYGNLYVPERVAFVCAQAPESVGQRCFTKLHALMEAGFFRPPIPPDSEPFIKGAEAYARGDWVGATNAWRPLSSRPGTKGTNLLPLAFDRAKEHELAENIDRASMERRRPLNGASFAHLRSALRAAELGDMERAEQLARVVTDAWSESDVPIPALSKLRPLLAPARR
jgi:predicted Ser/Thr protein kinase